MSILIIKQLYSNTKVDRLGCDAERTHRYESTGRHNPHHHHHHHHFHLREKHKAHIFIYDLRLSWR
jgi:hypothetical protein